MLSPDKLGLRVSEERPPVTVTSFRRYTNLAATIHMLRTQSITLLNPATWDDKNDAYFMAEYKRLKQAKTVLALCFAEQKETYHHWRVFSHGSDGVCIEFDKDKLLSTFENDDQIKRSNVFYKLIQEMSKLKESVSMSCHFLNGAPTKMNANTGSSMSLTLKRCNLRITA